MQMIASDSAETLKPCLWLTLCDHGEARSLYGLVEEEKGEMKDNGTLMAKASARVSGSVQSFNVLHKRSSGIIRAAFS
jgi:hypothetical protein